MTAPTPPPATGRDTGEACWARGADGEGNPNCSLTGDHDGPHSDQPPAPQAGASVEALVDFLCTLGLRRTFGIENTAKLFLASDWLAQRDAAVRAEVGERIASAIEARIVPISEADVDSGGFETGMDVGCNIGYESAARIARTTGGDR